jgi:hypothetical protein
VERPAAYGEPVEGTPFGRYRLIELLGRGGMGEVWRAHDTATNNRTVAIKLLPPQLAADPTFVQRFRREADAAARLNNPHIIPIHSYGEIDGRLYVDMRLIEGRDLQEVLADGPLEPGRAARIIEGVAKALHAAHEVGLLHRDVKPSNILLDRDDFAYLIDFGIARAADETRLTKSGNTIGTFQYIAPERLGAQAEEDARADIYSLACVLYECLTGHPPFAGDTMAGLVAAHLNTPPPQPSATQPKVSPQVDEVIATGMAKDPNQRYATTVELANAARDAITVPTQRPAPAPTLVDDAASPTPPPAPTQLADPAPAATQLVRADDPPRDVALTLARRASPFFWVPAAAGWTVAIIATLLLIASVLGPVRRLIRVPRGFVNDYLFNFPDTSLAWAFVLALLAAALTARKRIAWLLLLGYMILAAVLNVAEIAEGGNTPAENFGENLGFAFHFAAAVLLMLSYREFRAKVRRGALFKAAVVLITGWMIGMLLSWGLVQMFPGTLTPDHRFLYVVNRVVGFAVVDSTLFTGRPHVFLNAVMGLLGALALMAAAAGVVPVAARR